MISDSEEKNPVEVDKPTQRRSTSLHVLPSCKCDRCGAMMGGENASEFVRKKHSGCGGTFQIC